MPDTPSNMEQKRRNLLSTVGAAAAFGLTGCVGDGDNGNASPSPDGTDTDGDEDNRQFKLGILTALSGDLQYVGDMYLTSAEIIFDKLSTSDSMFQNTTLSYVSRDTETDAEQALSGAEELVESENVDALFGPVSSGVATAVSNYAFNQNIPFFVQPGERSLTAGENCLRTSLRLTVNLGQLATISTKWAQNNLGSRAYIIYPNYTYGLQIRDFSEKTINEVGGEVVDTAGLAPGATEWGPVIEDINNADPDYVQIAHPGGGAAAFLIQASSRNLDVPIVGEALLERLTGALTDDQFENLPETYWTGIRYYHKIDNQLNENFVNEYNKKNDEIPTMTAGLTYANYEFFLKCVDEADDYSTDGIIKACEDTSAETVLGEASIRGCDHQGSPPLFVGKLTGIDQSKDFGQYTLLNEYDSSTALVPCEETECPGFD
jgi:branched-chain amino acid transport system substrate-binding protein